MLERLVANLSGNIRYESLSGRKHIVAPLSMIVPGVLNGNLGPLLYTLEEISRDPGAWNGMPIVVNHPINEDGDPVSARSPDILEKFCIGQVFNTRVNGKLSAEGWFDVEKTRKIDARILVSLKAGRPGELSTGLSLGMEKAENAVHDGKPYVGIARNLKPDHLAILPDKKGACSQKDGCGFNVNKEDDDRDEATNEELDDYKIDWDGDQVTNQLSHSDLRHKLGEIIQNRYGMYASVEDVYDKKAVYSVYDNGRRRYYEVSYKSDLRKGKVSLSGEGTKEVFPETNYKPVVTHAAPGGGQSGKTEERSDKVLCDCPEGTECVCGTNVSENEEGNWSELLVTNALPSKEAGLSPAKACKILHDGSVNGKPLTAKQRRMFGAVCSRMKGKKSQNEERIDMPLAADKKKEIIDNLIINEGVEGDSPWVEEDRKALAAMSDERLSALDNQRQLAANSGHLEDDEDDDDELDGDEGGEDDDDEGRTTRNASRNGHKRIKLKESEVEAEQRWLASAPARIRQSVVNSMNIEKRERVKLIERIVANKNNKFSERDLRGFDLNMLEGLAALAVTNDEPPQNRDGKTDYSAQRGFIAFNQNLPDNFARQDQDMIPDEHSYEASAAEDE